MTASVTLDNCDQEPIHIPGLIQPHGVLLAIDLQGRLSHYSIGAEAVLGELPALGEVLAPHHLTLAHDAYPLIAEYWHAVIDGEGFTQTHELEIQGHGQKFDLVLHVNQGHVIAEFELRLANDKSINIYSLKAQKAINGIKSQRSIDAVLHVAAQEFRELTGFDRVMAYRFRHDGSGDIVAEAKREDLDSLVGRRYPASDIPAQARRLYVENTLRLIVDVGSQPVPVIKAAQTPPLDMSRSMLRSVSPIHIEYLRNMGVHASMSVSIVLNGKLWGMMACHHMTAHQVPYSIRMACDVLCLILASTVQQLETQIIAARQVASAKQRADLVLRFVDADELSTVLFSSLDQLREVIACDAMVLSYGRKVHVAEGAPTTLARQLVQWLNDGVDKVDFYHVSSIEQIPEELRAEMADYCGILAINIDKVNASWIILLRREQIHTINWGGKPEKNYAPGPLGPRLTPRGSFEEWKETVKGQSEPWSMADLNDARDLQHELLKVCNARNAETERTRVQLMAVLGHDLRDPLNSISMAAQLMEMQSGSSRMSERIKSSSGRMQRLVTQVLDMTRLQTGLGLNLVFNEVDISALLADLVEENLTAYPDVTVRTYIAPQVMAKIDSDRLSQVISNLISNARHHGELAGGVTVKLRTEPQFLHISVHNNGQPIADDIVDVLFNPFKRQALPNSRNRNGLGLGLYIANEIVRGHSGAISYRYENGEIVFNVELPLQR